MVNEVVWDFLGLVLFVFLLVGVVSLWYVVGRAGYERGVTHGMQPDSIVGMILAFVFFTGLAAIYWIARAYGSRHYRGPGARLPGVPPNRYPGL